MRVRHFFEPDLLVVSETYPPYSVGGAETSLHIVLKQLSVRMRLNVISLYDGALPKLEQVDGVNVVFLPKGPASEKDLRASLIVSLRHLYLLLCMEPGQSPAEPDIFEMIYMRTARGLKHAHFDVNKDYRDLADSFSRALVHETLRVLKPVRVHADNYRAAALCWGMSAFFSGQSSVMIRDNRFVCARSNNSMVVGGKICASCDRSCAAEDSPKDVEGKKSELKKIQDFRSKMIAGYKRVLVTGPHLKRITEEHLGIKARIVRNPSDDVQMVDSMISVVAQTPGRSVVVIGMLNENKGQLPFVKKYIDYLRAGPQPFVTFHFAGRGDRIRKQIESLMEKEKRFAVVFHDFLGREDLFRLIRSSHVVACPTIWPEPFGRVPLEAGLCGRPIVSFAVGGLPGSIQHEKTGFLVKPGDYRAFFDHQQKLLDDPEMAYAFGSAGREFICSTYSVDASCRELEAQLGLSE